MVSKVWDDRLLAGVVVTRAVRVDAAPNGIVSLNVTAFV